MAITALGDDLNSALELAYNNVDLINFEGKYERRDIGFDL